MRSSAFLAVLTAALLASAAHAQEDVTVNPVAGANQVLLYPGGQYMRVVPPLRQPGASNQPIHLHMPRSTSTAKAAAPRVAGSEPAVAPPKPAPARVARAKPPAPVKAPPAEAPVRTASEPPAASLLPGAMPGATGILASPNAPVTQLARATPAPPQTTAAAGVAGLTKRSVILFAPSSADPAQSALGAIKFLAGDLNAALGSANSRIQLLAYGGAHGDKSSDARRLSLKRALAIRQVLIDDGVPAERIDVSAMGGADDGGPLDRVDVFIRA